MKPGRIKASVKCVIYFFISLLFTKSFTATAQSVPDYHNADSILYQLQKSRPDSNRVSLLNELAADYLSKNELSAAEFEAVFKHLEHAVALSDSLHLPFVNRKAQSLHLMGSALVLGNKVAQGKAVFMELVKNAHDAGDKRREAESWVAYEKALWDANKLDTFRIDAEAADLNAMAIYHEIKELKIELNIGLRLAAVYFSNLEFSKAEKLLLSLIKQSEAIGSRKLPYAYYLLSVVNRYIGNYNKALGYALHAVKEMDDSNDYATAETCYGELGEVYQALNKPAESVIWYRKCIEQREAMTGYPNFFLYRTYSLLIVQLIKAGAQKEALATIKDLQRRRPPVTSGERAVFFQSMAYCYDAVNVYDSTEKYFVKMVESYHKANEGALVNEEIYLLAYYDIAEFYIKSLQFTKARPFLDIIISKPNSVKVSKMADAQLLLFKVDSAAGNYLAAIRHMQQYKTLADSVFSEKKSLQIEQLQVEYNTEKKDQAIRLLTKKEQLQQANLRQANIIRNWTVASAVLLTLLLIAGYNRYQFKQKTNKRLETQQIVINQKNVSLQRLVHEKEWLIKEIHHRVKNNFHIVMGLLGTQSGYLKNEEAIAAINESQQRIHAMSLIHQKLYQSDNLSSIDMPGYIYELVDYLKDSFDNSMAIRFHLQVDRINIALSHVIPIGLILNEAITNVFKYAFPGKKEGNIYISFTHNSENDQVVLTVRDDGTGLPAEFNSNVQSSMGLNLMKGLSGDIDGSFTMQSNNGTIVTVSFIYNPNQPEDFLPSDASQNFTV
ncbi:Two-component sensor histidine kinase, contains HisKA and HATPase domains [Filimonas lacunae]|uniref:histidine kinase n=1 Tax=Filimonas lacunae TaxID=477680 RepID=A0A173MJE1_9BACT|nr:histidine kinase dimerization/phosphoacceptor domain -containing protein [Filimonas lacunae]BAV07576.1 sensor histidine kinase [Filimonas lacunae]SIT29903.1 Two-component sensor histidine kinase, contains HisKA and HATPase domains [Filimonas lacunae]